MQPAAGDWCARLEAARKDLRLSRTALAELSGVSAPTIKAYEHGLRHPTRGLLIAILEALKLERNARDSILVDAGLAPDGRFLGPDSFPDYMFTAEEALQHMEELPWPAFIFNEFLEVVVANRIAQRLWGIDLDREFPKPIDRNMLAVSSSPRFAGKVDKWDEMVSVAISVFKGHHRGPEALERLSPYFAEVVQRFSQGSPEYAARLRRSGSGRRAATRRCAGRIR
jgi:transcriptional regulator with XRE-family HTH domain